METKTLFWTFALFLFIYYLIWLNYELHTKSPTNTLITKMQYGCAQHQKISVKNYSVK